MSDKKENPVVPESSGTSRKTGARMEEVLMRDAYALIVKEKYEEAARILDDILKKFAVALEIDQKILLNTELGRIYFYMGDYNAARLHCEAALAFGDSDEAHNILGKLEVARFRFPQARSHFSKISTENPARNLGFCLIAIKLRDTTGASSFLKEVSSKVKSTDPEFVVYRAYVVLLKGDSKTAVAEARAVEQKCSRDPFLTLLLAEIFMTAGNYGEAEAQAKKAGKSCPENDSVYAVLAHAAYAKEDYDGADHNARRAVEINPLNAYAQTVLMKLATREGRYNIAENIGLQILADCPEYALAHANLGDVYFNQDRYEMAEVQYEQTAQLMDADTKGARLRKARVQFVQENYAEAANILEKLIESHHTYYDDAMCDLVLCYDKMGEEEKKEDLMEKMEMRRSFYHRTEDVLRSFGEGL